MSDIPFEVTGYLTISKSFIKNKPEKKFFALNIYKGNPDFDISNGAYILCMANNNAKDGDLVISREVIKDSHVYSVHRYKKAKDFIILENSFGKRILDLEWKPFGRVYKVFNIPE